MPRFKDQAICIRVIDWSETSQIVVLLTAGQGKVRGVAKGSRRANPSSVQKFSGGIDLLTAGQALGVIKPTTDLAVLTEWDLQEPMRHLRTDLHAQGLGLYVADLTHHLLADHDPHERVFEALLVCLRGLESPQGRAMTVLRYVWLLLCECGYQPELRADVRSGLALVEQSSYGFDAQRGGLVGDASGEGVWRVRKETVQLLRALSTDTEHDATAQGASEQTIERANKLLCVYARAVLDRDLPTMAIVLGS
jgi:DNA repair protein RecO (recombination protein O)